MLKVLVLGLVFSENLEIESGAEQQNDVLTSSRTQ